MIIVSPSPCPPEEFSGRYRERKDILNILSCVKNRGQVILISGAVGSGKSSLLHWAAEEIQKTGGLENLAITKEFYETSGMAFKTYKDLLKDLQGHTKGGRFRAIIGNDEVLKSLNTALNLLETFTSVAEPVGASTRIVKVITSAVAPPQKVGYEHVLSSILTVFQKISVELKKNDRFIAILLDDVQWSSETDFQLLKDLIRNIPPNIALLLTYRREDKTNQMYEELMGELNRLDQTEIPLYQLDSAGIQDFAARRYNLSLDESAARYLEQKVGDPFSLVVCFNLLQKKGLSPNMNNLETILSEALEKPARSFLSGLDQSSRDRVNQLCILEPPIPFSVIACITGTKPQEAARLQSDLDNSIVFRRIEHGLYDFGHSSLREYCRSELPEMQELKLHKQATRCFENLLDRLPNKQHASLSLAKHAFYGEDYQTAFDLNFALGEGAYAHYDYPTALELVERAKISAEQLHDRNKLAAAYHHLGMILQALYKYPEALDNYTQGLAIEREIGNREGEAGTLHQVGIVYSEMCQYEKALECYTRSLTISQEVGDQFGEAATLHQIGLLHEEKRRYDKALEYYQQSLAISREIEEQAGEAKTLHQIGSVYVKIQQYGRALDYYDQSLAISRKTGNLALNAVTLNQIGMVYRRINLPDKALECYNQSLAITREIGDRVNEAGALHQIGMIYELIQTDKALNYYNQSLAISREIGNRRGEVLTLAQIGHHFMTTSRFKESIRSFGKALPIALQDQMREASFRILLDLALILNQMGEEQFTVAWGEAFDGDAPPLETIRKSEKVFKEAMGIN